MDISDALPAPTQLKDSYTQTSLTDSALRQSAVLALPESQILEEEITNGACDIYAHWLS